MRAAARFRHGDCSSALQVQGEVRHGTRVEKRNSRSRGGE